MHSMLSYVYGAYMPHSTNAPNSHFWELEQDKLRLCTAERPLPRGQSCQSHSSARVAIRKLVHSVHEQLWLEQSSRSRAGQCSAQVLHL
jgi:hypothetical protein